MVHTHTVTHNQFVTRCKTIVRARIVHATYCDVRVVPTSEHPLLRSERHRNKGVEVNQDLFKQYISGTRQKTNEVSGKVEPVENYALLLFFSVDSGCRGK